MEQGTVEYNELQERLRTLGQKLQTALEHQDGPFSLDLQEIEDIVEFINLFLE